MTSNKERDGIKFGKAVVKSRNTSHKGQWCTYCKKPQHTRETCFKLHGKEAVLNKIGGFKNMKHQSYLSSKEPKERTKKGEPKPTETNLNQLNLEELDQLKALLRTFQDGASCSLVQQGKYLSYSSFSASKTNWNNMWILDLGATDHLTPNLHVFETYAPLETTRRITIANGISIPIAGKGKVHLSPQLSINHVLHVPNLTTNLISIQQLTKDLNCHALFSLHMCKF